MLTVERRGRVACVRMTRGRGNALNLEFLHAWLAELESLRTGDARAVVITGEGKVFCAGVDLREVLAGGEAYLDDFLPALIRFFERLALFPKPVVAAVNGHAIAGGGIITLACDQRLMARGTARIGLTEAQVGVAFPTWAIEIARHATPPEHFPTLVGAGRTWDAEAALARGLLDEVVEPAELEPRALAVAEELAAIPAETFAMTKRQIRRPLIEAVERRAPIDDAAARALWKSPAVRQHMEAFMVRNVGKK